MALATVNIDKIIKVTSASSYVYRFAVYFLLDYLNVHNLLFLSMVHEYAYKT